MTHQIHHKGHCRCGSVDITATGEPQLCVYCHCDDCRRATGAPLLAAVGFEKQAIVWNSASTLSRYTAGSASRLFCNNCGSPVAQEHKSADHMTFFNTGFMDEPERYPPTYHTFAGRQISWLKMHDDLPRTDATLMIKPD